MPLLILALIAAIPVVEIMLFVQVGGEIGALSTILLTVFTAFAGLALVRLQGLDVVRRAQANQRKGIPLVGEAIDGLGLALAGLCLLIPGFFTDCIGAVLLVPPARRALLGPLAKRAKSKQSQQAENPDVIEGEFTIVDAQKPNDRLD